MSYYKPDSLLHGGDYNVEQWLNRPDILAEDIRLMKKAGVNVVTLGVFAWAMYEPQEGEYHFEWLDNIMDSMYQNKIYVILATPSAGKPPWMIQKYPEIMRTNANRIRLLYGERENHCNSNLIFRKKVKEIDKLLAERYAHHPALIMWHLSNEMYGTCHCEDCQNNFRKWLKTKYGTIENLNKEYWSIFWSHKYTDFSELESPSAHGETAVHGLALDYQRFYSDLSIDFIKEEADTVKAYNPDIPVTTNMFHFNCGIDLAKLSKVIDVISWDSYPRWHCDDTSPSEWNTAVTAAFGFDFCRTQKQKPFLLMESTPSTANGFRVTKLKRPGMHMLSSMQAIACGSDSVQYFQWRKSLGSYEKFHGAVISHNGSEDTRVFKDVCTVGAKLTELKTLKDSCPDVKVALMYDWDNMRALEEQKNLRPKNPCYQDIIMEHYEALLKNYVSVDIIHEESDFSQYSLIVAPMLYLFKPDTPTKIRSFIENGGCFVMGPYSGLVNENDLAYECFPPYSLNDVFGIYIEETDSLLDGEFNSFTYQNKKYQAYFCCDLAHECNAEMISAYEKDFYKGLPVISHKPFGNGNAYYIAARTDKDFLYDFYQTIIRKEHIPVIMDAPYVSDIMIKERTKDGCKYLFLMNFSPEQRTIQGITLNGYECRVCID